MSTIEKEKVAEFHQKLAKLIEEEQPDNCQILLVSGTVDENNDEEESHAVNAFVTLIGNSRKFNLLIKSAMGQAPELRNVLTRAIVPESDYITEFMRNVFRK